MTKPATDMQRRDLELPQPLTREQWIAARQAEDDANDASHPDFKGMKISLGFKGMKIKPGPR